MSSLPVSRFHAPRRARAGQGAARAVVPAARILGALAFTLTLALVAMPRAADAQSPAPDETALAPSSDEAPAPQAVRRWGGSLRAGSKSELFQSNDGGMVAQAVAGNTALASASFLNSTLRASASANPDGGYGCGWWEASCLWGISASASLYDVVTIRPGPVAGPVSWSFTIHGDGHKGRRLGNGSWSAYSRFYFATTAPEQSDVQPTKLGAGTVTFSGSHMLGSAPQTFHFFMALEVFARNGAWVDFGNTMRFSWTLPAGATYETASGAIVAPTVAPGPVTTAPEPATAALLGAGLAALGARAARRRRTPEAGR